MTLLYLHGIGACAIGFDEEFGRGGRLSNVPIKEHAKPALRRRYGRLAKTKYVAAKRALADCGDTTTEEIAVVSATAMGEVAVGLELVEQIHSTNGKTLGPALVTNSVHNAPAGHLMIGLGSRAPSLTVSQGWLSATAALATAMDLVAAGLSARLLVVAGDEADPQWVSRLGQIGAPQAAEALQREAFAEGALAVVVGAEPGGRALGTLAADVARSSSSSEGIVNFLGRTGVTPGPQTAICVRHSTGGEALRGVVASALARPSNEIRLDGPGRGSSQAGALASLAFHLREEPTRELLVLEAEVDELALLYFRPLEGTC